jgi:hypothetical protein
MTQATELRELATLLNVDSTDVTIGRRTSVSINDATEYSSVEASELNPVSTDALYLNNIENTSTNGKISILMRSTGSGGGTSARITLKNDRSGNGSLRFLFRDGDHTTEAKEKFAFTSDGKLGVGLLGLSNINNPQAPIHVGTDSTVSTESTVIIEAPIYPSLEFDSQNTNVNNRRWKFSSVYNSYGTFEILRGATSGAAPTVTTMSLTKDGRVAIGPSQVANYVLDVQGDIHTTTSFRADEVRHSIRPSLNLDFANSKELDSRITFYRNSIATYYDSKGTLKYANINEPRFDHDPLTGESKGLLIEEARTNIFTYTNNPERWPLMSGSSSDPIANNIKSPDGTFNATSLIIDGSDPYFYQNGLTLNGTYTFSYWIKAVGTAIGKQYTTRITNVSSNSSTAGTLPSEWTRYTFTFTTGSTTTAYIGIEAPDNSPADGDEISIWGAQLELGAFATSLIPSDTRFTSRASVATYYDETGVLRTAPADGARHGYKYDGRNWVETGLILEEAATNRKQNFISSAGALQWSTNQNSEPAANNTVKSPDDSYSTIRQKINSTATAIHSIYDFTTVTAGTQLCFSVYAKAAEYNRIYMYTDGITPTIGGVFYDLSNGTIGGLSVIARDAYGIEDVGNGWYRCWYSGTPTSGTTAYWHIDLAQSDSTRAFAGTVGQGLYLWGPQMEYNGALSSYIYTDTSAVTRAADVATSVAYTRDSDYAYIDIEKYNFWNDRESTIYAETETYIEDYTLGNYNASQYAFSPDSGRVQIRYDNNDGIHAIGYSTPAGVFTNMFTLTPPTATFVTSSKTALSIKQDDYDFSVNGSTISGTASDTSGAFPAPTKLFLGAYREVASPSNSEHLNGVIKKISYYDKKLTNAEMQALTENN